jgi:hypothetical protein
LRVLRRIRAVASAPPPKISTIAVNAQRRSVTTSGLTDASLSVFALVGRTARPGVVGFVLGGGVVVGGVVVAGSTGDTAARSATLVGGAGVSGGGGGGTEWVVGGGDVGGRVGVVGGGGLVGGGGGGGGLLGSPSPMVMHRIDSRQIRKSGAVTCSLRSETGSFGAATASGDAARNRTGTAVATVPILVKIREQFPELFPTSPHSPEFIGLADNDHTVDRDLILRQKGAR